MPNPIKKAQRLLASFRGRLLTRSERMNHAVALSALLLEAARLEKKPNEQKQEAWFSRMMKDPQGRTFITAMTDQCFRSSSPTRTAEQLVFLIKKYGVPHFLDEKDRIKFHIFRFLGPFLPTIFMPLIKNQIRNEMANVLLPEQQIKQEAYFRKCWKENIRINLNHLGEAILGEREAQRRLNIYLNDLANPLIEYISIKISTIYSQINMIGFHNTLEALTIRLRMLYSAAKKNTFKRIDGTVVNKFVNLDMEEYRDLDLTVALFQRVLDEPDFKDLEAGIVLQSYLPDSFEIQKKLTEWALWRTKQGGAPIRIRIVKGANLAMELVESSLRNWQQAPFETKVETDANFKRMLEFACTKERAHAVHIGIGSHNLFDIAYALILRSENEVEEKVSFEMLEGMALPLRRVIKQVAKGMLIYCPEAKDKDFQHAVAYLIRRLDENCGQENFLRHFFEMKPGNLVWKAECDKFIQGCLRIDFLSSNPRRNQNRFDPPILPYKDEPFKNEPDTDFSLSCNRKWAEEIFAEWMKKKETTIPLVIDGEEIISNLKPGIDPSNPTQPYYFFSRATSDLAERAVRCAVDNQRMWSTLPYEERSFLLGQVAHKFRERRKKLIGAMIADAGKTIWEADPEISEAIDFLEYYRKNWEKQLNFSDLKWKAKGTALVAPPWNFPCSIPVSGIAAALVAGNCVLFKPAPETVLVGWEVAKIFWEAGISRKVLQFINCDDDPIGSYLVKHPKVSTVILTGSTYTAKNFLKLRPGIDLHAETGGKNAIIITAMSDRDLAIRDLIISAFSHSGQKCSACSLAILESEVYDDPNFKKQLFDAASSLIVDSAWNPQAKITPLIRPPEGALKQSLTTMEQNETWLLTPQPINSHLWTPGIKWGVEENSFTHQTELFGPVLGVMRAENLDEAIRLANGTPYGLTSGLHSLDEREQKRWQLRIQAGNLYINRGITGAIVRRQPFGGWKSSTFGTGSKAGGPNYVHQFAHAVQQSMPHEKEALPKALIPLAAALNTFSFTQKELQLWKKSAENYAYWAKILKEPIDFQPLIGQDNYFYHVPLDRCDARLESSQHLLPLMQVAAACLICQTPLEISSTIHLPQIEKIPGIKVKVEEEAELFKKNLFRLRIFHPATDSFMLKAAEKGIILQADPVLCNGRFELLNYLREVSVSIDYHRYGYLGQRDPSITKF